MRLAWSPSSRLTIAVYSVYGWVNGHDSRRAAARTSALLEACAEGAHAQRDRLALIVGDLNADLADLACWGGLAQLGWADSGALFAPDSLSLIHI
eukprot:15299548-Alexandrium_andersonii.AAC.1